MKEDELLTPEGMDLIAEQYETTYHSKGKHFKELVEDTKRREIKEMLTKLKNYAEVDKNFPALYLLKKLSEEFEGNK